TDSSNATVSQTFQLRVIPVNDPPTLDPIADINLLEDAGRQTVRLTHVSAGAPNEQQTLLFAVTSSNPSLIPNPVIDYHNPNTEGSLIFTPQPNASGTSVITVTLDDRGASNNIIVRTFQVNVSPVNDLPTISQIQ